MVDAFLVVEALVDSEGMWAAGLALEALAEKAAVLVPQGAVPRGGVLGDKESVYAGRDALNIGAR